MHGWRRPASFAALMAALFALGWLVPTAPSASLARPEAAPVVLPIPDVIAGGVDWQDLDNTIQCRTSNPGVIQPFNINDAEFVATMQGDAYDNAFCLFVNSAPFLLPGPPSTVDQTGTTVTAGPVSLSGLNVTQQFFFLPSFPVVRVMANLTNPTGAPITVPVTFETDLGSDSQTQVVGSSSGGLVFNASTRWAITADSPTDPPGDPPLIHVIFGPGTPPVTPSIAGIAIAGPLCTDGPDATAWCVSYNVTVPAGATRRLMLFDQLNATIAQAQTSALFYNSNPPQGSEFLSGLTPAQLLEVVNWQFPADVAIVKTDAPDPQLVGGPVTYTLAVNNNGPYDATGVTTTDPLPAGATFVSATPSQGTCTTPPVGSGGTVTCTLGSLANGASATVTVVVTATTAGTLTNTATVSANQFDPNPANNTSTASTTITAPTPTPTSTSTATSTPTLTTTSTPTTTATAVATSTATAIATSTATAIATSTATAIATSTATAIATSTATAIATSTATAIATSTATAIATSTATAAATSTATAIATATLTPSPTATFTQGVAPTPQVSGTPGVGCTTVIGGICQVAGAVNGVWTKTGSGVFNLSATGPTGALVGAIPTLFIPTTVNPNGESFSCAPTSATLTTTCTGTTRGDALCGGIVTVDFPLAAGGFGVSTGIVTCAPTGTLVVCKQIQVLDPTGLGLNSSLGFQSGLGLNGLGLGSGLGLQGSTATFTTPAGGPTIPSITIPVGQLGPVCAAGVAVAAGTVAVTEVVPTGFTLQSVTGGTLAGNTATATISSGTTTTLTFINVPTTVIIPSPPLLPPPPLLLPPPPAALLPPPPPPAPPAANARAPAGFPEVPVIPEADSLPLFAVGLVTLGILAGARARRRRS